MWVVRAGNRRRKLETIYGETEKTLEKVTRCADTQVLKGRSMRASGAHLLRPEVKKMKNVVVHIAEFEQGSRMIQGFKLPDIKPLNKGSPLPISGT